MKISIIKMKEDTVRCLLFKSIVITMQVFFSCSSQIFFDSGYRGGEVVVNSIITPDSLFSCHLSLLIEPLQQDFNMIENAEVKIEHVQTGELIATLEYSGGGWYRSSAKRPEIGVQYRLLVLIEGYDSITAETVIPSRARAEDFDLRFQSTLDKTSVNPNPEMPIHTLSFTIIDNIGNDDFYDFSVHHRLCLHARLGSDSLNEIYIPFYELEDTVKKNPEILDGKIHIRLDTLMIYNARYDLYCVDPVIVSESVLAQYLYYPNLMFSDQSFKDGSKQVFTDVGYGMQRNSCYSAVYSGSTLLCLRSLSPELFMYMQTVRKQQIAVSDHLFNPLTGSFSPQNTAVDVFSNIENGYGIFAGYSVKNYIIAEDGKEYWWHQYVVQ